LGFLHNKEALFFQVKVQIRLPVNEAPEPARDGAERAGMVLENFPVLPAFYFTEM
jgi:hypothetical protein